jgi:trk/ktr system potassium uptake protein
MFLMFVGGSPSSTAGGIKTSTLAIAVLSLRRILLGRAEIEAFGRRFSEETANRALAIVLLSIAFITVVTVALCALHPKLSPFDLAFEAVSAVSTVGLTRAVTPLLETPARVVLVVAMFVGRIGVLFFLLSLLPHRRPTGYRLPETSIVIS